MTSIISSILGSKSNKQVPEAVPVVKTAGTVEFYPPAAGGGTMLDVSGGPTLGEPLNVIISGTSSPAVLTDDGVLNWARSIGFSTEFMGLHLGTPQTANLGDGNGVQNEIKVIRQDYGSVVLGTGIESLVGGNHFRYWRQNGPTANSGALFLATSHEQDVTQHHNIVPNGYDKGRDELVARAVGQTSHGGVKYSTTSREITGLLPVGATGINHNIAIDGKVVLLTITII
ncbi:hypothetical protein BU17DRAFT_41281 [Hysterangium stoloniferum]|nr:hypothetical protein BU17DRAFT_41281 [Hysterangium stoloniferum]